jgi:precorrin-6B methylase 2
LSGDPDLLAEIGDFADTVERDVPFVPTNDDVVNEMIRLANDGSDDVLYDLGSGDGRIVITAAQETGCRGVGIDIDPERIAESEANLEDSGVQNVEFVLGDLFEADISEATVVTMYLLESVNERLRPKLLAELKPGTRLVSHAFSLGDWEPDQSAQVNGSNVYNWMVPANFSGTWEWENGSGEKDSLEVKQKFQKASGKQHSSDGDFRIEKINIQGGKIYFEGQALINGKAEPALYEAELKGDGRLEGTIKAGEVETEWKAKRKNGTDGPIDI